jgi:hypothetical protein
LGSVEQSTTSLLRPLDDSGSNFSASSFLAEVAGQNCSGHAIGAAVGDSDGSLDGAAVGAFVGEGVTGVDAGDFVGEQVNDVSHCVFVMLPPSQVPRLPGFPLFGKHWLSLSQELPLVGCVVGAEHVP